jgi:hypothetical protein
MADQLSQFITVMEEWRRSHSDHATKQDLDTVVHKLMSAITDWATQEQANLDGISTQLDAIVAGVKALDDKITALQNTPGTLSPSNQAALDAIQAASKALVTKAQAIDTTPPA